MPQSEARAWWADVQHVRESIERRRAGIADSSAPLDAPDDGRFTRSAAESLPPWEDLDWMAGSPAYSSGRFDRTGRVPRGDHPPTRARRSIEERRSAEEWRGDERRGVDERRRVGERRSADGPRSGDAAADRFDVATAVREELSDVLPSAATATASGATAALAPPPARRTVQITGRTVSAPPLPRLVEVERRRPARRPAERVGPRPDRIALWAVLLGFFLILVAATSSNAAVHRAHADRAAVALHAPAR